MSSYYYLISSLPTLSTETNVITYGSFLQMCKTSLNSNTYEELSKLSLNDMDSFKGCALVREFGKYYSRLRKELSYQRNQKLSKPAEKPSESDSEIEKTVSMAMNAKDPLEAENILLNAQFDFADSLCTMHYFDDYVLFAYALKIRLLERKLIFKHDVGLEEFNRLFNVIQKQIDGVSYGK